MNANNQQLASRRGFLGKMVAGATAIGVSTVMNPLKAAETAFSSATGPEIENWFNKIKGKHRVVFDGPEFNGGMPLAFPRVFQLTNNQVGVSNEDLGIVIVFRHNAVGLGLDNTMWQKYKLGEVFGIDDPRTGKPSERNFFWQPAQGELEIPGMAINELQNSGALFCLCEMAILHYSGVVSKKLGLEHETVRKDWLAHILPGVQPVPSGVFAVNRSQEHGCSYCFAG